MEAWIKHVVNTLCHAVDIAPTLLDLVGAKKPSKVGFDGTSIKNLLDSNKKVQWTDRMLVTDSQRVRDPIKWRKSSVMSQQWRLVNGTELYEIAKDPGQTKDVAKENPKQVAKMRAFYDQWWPSWSQLLPRQLNFT